jgi:hypothetical protein
MLAKPNGSYSSDDLTILSRVLEEALTEGIDGAGLTDPAVQDLRSRLGKVIMDHFTAGEIDPERLKAIAVESIQRQ